MGRPAVVCDSGVVSSNACAASQPSSPGEDHDDVGSSASGASTVSGGAACVPFVPLVPFSAGASVTAGWLAWRQKGRASIRRQASIIAR